MKTHDHNGATDALHDANNAQRAISNGGAINLIHDVVIESSQKCLQGANSLQPEFGPLRLLFLVNVGYKWSNLSPSCDSPVLIHPILWIEAKNRCAGDE